MVVGLTHVGLLGWVCMQFQTGRGFHLIKIEDVLFDLRYQHQHLITTMKIGHQLGRPVNGRSGSCQSVGGGGVRL